MKIGSVLLKFRRERRLSQMDVAEQLSISQSTYCAWESDRVVPSTKNYCKIASLLKVTVQELFSNDRDGQTDTILQSSFIHEDYSTSPFSTQVLHMELISSQKQNILLLQRRISELEIENEHLREQLKQKID